MEHKITNVQRRNEWGDQMLDYAIALEGQQGWIKLTQKVSTPPPMIGDMIRGRVETKQNKNGNSYLKFTKERESSGGFPQSNSTSSGSQEAYIVQMLEELTGRRKVQDTIAPMPEQPDDMKFDDPFEGLL